MTRSCATARVAQRANILTTLDMALGVPRAWRRESRILGFPSLVGRSPLVGGGHPPPPTLLLPLLKQDVQYYVLSPLCWPSLFKWPSRAGPRLAPPAAARLVKAPGRDRLGPHPGHDRPGRHPERPRSVTVRGPQPARRDPEGDVIRARRGHVPPPLPFPWAPTVWEPLASVSPI
jgi:hypothetical protein